MMMFQFSSIQFINLGSLFYMVRVLVLRAVPFSALQFQQYPSRLRPCSSFPTFEYSMDEFYGPIAAFPLPLFPHTPLYTDSPFSFPSVPISLPSYIRSFDEMNSNNIIQPDSISHGLSVNFLGLFWLMNSSSL